LGEGYVVNSPESEGRLGRKIDPAYFMITMFPFLFFERVGKQ
jgi:hypothetical protein